MIIISRMSFLNLRITQLINQRQNNYIPFLKQSDFDTKIHHSMIYMVDIYSCSKTFYDHKSTLSTRCATLGFGEKTNFTKLFTVTPPPGTYNIS